jgi:hypothetical protein
VVGDRREVYLDDTVSVTVSLSLSPGFRHRVFAEWTFTVAVGAINSSLNHSSFSNHGTSGRGQYIMMPGGEESGGAATERIGEATKKCYGTLPAAAYASGIFALYTADPTYSGQSGSSFLSGPFRGQRAPG